MARALTPPPPLSGWASLIYTIFHGFSVPLAHPWARHRNCVQRRPVGLWTEPSTIPSNSSFNINNILTGVCFFLTGGPDIQLSSGRIFGGPKEVPDSKWTPDLPPWSHSIGSQGDSKRIGGILWGFNGVLSDSKILRGHRVFFFFFRPQVRYYNTLR